MCRAISRLVDELVADAPLKCPSGAFIVRISSAKPGALAVAPPTWVRADHPPVVTAPKLWTTFTLLRGACIGWLRTPSRVDRRRGAGEAVGSPASRRDGRPLANRRAESLCPRARVRVRGRRSPASPPAGGRLRMCRAGPSSMPQTVTGSLGVRSGSSTTRTIDRLPLVRQRDAGADEAHAGTACRQISVGTRRIVAADHPLARGGVRPAAAPARRAPPPHTDMQSAMLRTYVGTALGSVRRAGRHERSRAPALAGRAPAQLKADARAARGRQRAGPHARTAHKAHAKPEPTPPRLTARRKGYGGLASGIRSPLDRSGSPGRAPRSRAGP